MASTWWLLSALILGGFTGILVFALMDMAQKEEKRAARAEKTLKLQLLGLPELDRQWGTTHSPRPARNLASEPKHRARIAA